MIYTDNKKLAKIIIIKKTNSGAEKYYNWIENFTGEFQQQIWVERRNNRETSKQNNWNYRMSKPKKKKKKQKEHSEPKELVKYCVVG